MALDRKLADWQAAGLIDRQTADAIAAHDAARERPVLRWAAVAIGLLATALGISLLVAANWDTIPAWLKIAVHGLLTIGAAIVAFMARHRPRLREAALFLLGALVLAGIALQDQIYQVPQPLWGLLALGGALIAPAVLLAGTTRLTSVGLSLLLALAALAYGLDMPRSGALPAVLAGNLALALPSALLFAGVRLHGRGGFADGFRNMGLALILGCASLAHFAWAVEVPRADALALLLRLPLALALGLSAALAVKRNALLTRTVIAASAAAILLAIATPHGDTLGARLFGAFAFLILWGVVARAAADSGWRVLFGIAVAAIALRLFIIYFELFGSLASTGLGLLAGGALLIGLALAWDRIVRRRSS